jgi:hypothetical protein
MKTTIHNYKDVVIDSHQQYYVGGFVVIIFLILFIIKRQKINKIKQFLFANNYTEVNFKNQKMHYPDVSISNSKIVIKKSNKITAKKVLEDREVWEKCFNIRILTVEDESRKTIIYLG